MGAQGAGGGASEDDLGLVWIRTAQSAMSGSNHARLDPGSWRVKV